MTNYSQLGNSTMALGAALQHGFSRLAGKIANCQCPRINKWLVRKAIKKLNIDLKDAEKTEFNSLNDLFTRKLKKTARAIAPAPNIACPIDGTLTQWGNITPEQKMLVKQHQYSLETLFGPHKDLYQLFENGHYACFYLAPHNYHRVHCPMKAELTHMLSVPGQLFSVNTQDPKVPKDVFTKNERVIATFKVKNGHMAVIFVGATLVGCTHTKWAGQVTPSPHKQSVARHNYQPKQFCYQQGEELGHFQFGSSIIVLFSQNNSIQWDSDINTNSPVLMGQKLGTSQPSEANK
jgi:phosphatidylserine decarboxylase